jgi:hypothetical protein
VTHGVHPAVKKVKTPDLAPIRNRVAVQSCREQLRDRDHSMLRSGDFGDQKVRCVEFVEIIAMNFVHPVYVRASPPPKGSAATLSSHLNAQFVTYRR